MYCTYISTIAHAQRDQSNDLPFHFFFFREPINIANFVLGSVRREYHRTPNRRRAAVFVFPPSTQLLLGWLSAVLLQCTVGPVYNDCEAIRKRTWKGKEAVHARSPLAARDRVRTARMGIREVSATPSYERWPLCRTFVGTHRCVIRTTTDVYVIPNTLS